MLQLSVPALELYDESTESFLYTKPTELRLEHSLVSLSKWESEWKKPFLTRDGVSDAEFRDYIRCMSLTQNVDGKVFAYMPAELVDRVRGYIDESRTATWFRDRGASPPSREIVTSELIYYWMTVHSIPFEAQKWHLSRLLTLIKICSVKADTKKMSRTATMQQNRALNAARRAKSKSRG